MPSVTRSMRRADPSQHVLWTHPPWRPPLGDRGWPPLQVPNVVRSDLDEVITDESMEEWSVDESYPPSSPVVIREETPPPAPVIGGVADEWLHTGDVPVTPPARPVIIRPPRLPEQSRWGRMEDAIVRDEDWSWMSRFLDTRTPENIANLLDTSLAEVEEATDEELNNWRRDIFGDVRKENVPDEDVNKELRSIMNVLDEESDKLSEGKYKEMVDSLKRVWDKLNK